MPKAFSDTSQDIVVRTGEVFTIELASNPTTGYQWELDFDHTRVKLLGDEHRRMGVGIGAGGVQEFTIQPLETGSTSIRASYKRAWEKEPIERREFRLRVTP
jgi:inhibitor of cysteine peptidase